VVPNLHAAHLRAADVRGENMLTEQNTVFFFFWSEKKTEHGWLYLAWILEVICEPELVLFGWLTMIGPVHPVKQYQYD
jgi:hypothetical protein